MYIECNCISMDKQISLNIACKWNYKYSILVSIPRNDYGEKISVQKILIEYTSYVKTWHE